MVYALERDVNSLLRMHSRAVADARYWRRADMENIKGQRRTWGGVLSGLGRNNLRFIAEPRIFNRLDELTANIETGREEMVDIFE